MKTSSAKKPRILVLAEYFLPGYKAGGPIRTLDGLTQRLGEEFEFSVLTRDRDYTDTKPYAQVTPHRWSERGPVQVMYLPPGALSPLALARVISERGFEALYLNSLFSPRFAVLPLLLRRLKLIPRKPVILAPRGELGLGALAAKSWKKRPYLFLARGLGLFSDVRWQASSPFEAQQIKALAGQEAAVMVAPDLPPLPREADAPQREPKQAGKLKLLFLARLGRHKNLDYALSRLAELDPGAQLSIVGPREDEPYWRECRHLMDGLPPGISAQYLGQVEPGQVPAIMADHHALLLPTKGENFGHSILEALLAGAPVVISDRTPWRDLPKRRAGWDLPLDEPAAFTDALKRLQAMDDNEFQVWSGAARELGRQAATSQKVLEANRDLFSGLV